MHVISVCFAFLLDQSPESLNRIVCCVNEGGFKEFKAKYPSLCTSSEMRCLADQKTHPHQSSLSQPCLPVSNVGPTRVLPFLFLGSQLDSMSRETMLVGRAVRQGWFKGGAATPSKIMAPL